MDFPQSLTVKVLELQHPEYRQLAPTWTRIDDLSAGGWQLEAKKAVYLKPRPGEEPDLYKIRLDRFTYVNCLGEAIAQQTSKLSSGALSISGLADEKFWEAFRENTNGAGRSEKALIAEMFRTALKFKTVYLHVEKPYLEAPPTTRQQEELLGIRPYVCVYSPLEVTNWSEERERLQWLKVRQLNQVSDPFKPAQTKATWTYIDDTHIAKYEALVRLDKNGKIAATVDAQGNDLEVGEDAHVQLTRPPVAHNFGRIPVLEVELPDDLWATNQAFLLALEHLNLLNSQYDTAMMVGYVQRTWKPHVTPDNDLDHTFVDSQEDLKTGNQYVIKGDFGFSEASGSSVNTVEGILAKLEAKIKDIIGLSHASASKGAMQQSGVSKKMDFVIQEVVLRALGRIICDAYQDTLQLVAQAHKLTTPEEISVTGLDSFDVDDLETMLAVALEIAQIEDRIPETALKLFYQQLASLLVRNASADQQQQIKDELEKIFSRPLLPLPMNGKPAAPVMPVPT